MKALLLVREVPRRKAPVALRSIVFGFALVGAFVAVLDVMYPPRVMKFFSESKSDVAKATVKKYVYEAYPSWRAVHQKPCPYMLVELNAYMTNKDIYDPWGVPYEMRCDDSGIVVHSLGEDRTYDTADDLWSFE